jgi:TonB-dependent starch-binding outer membrane protein SusC
MKKQLHKVFISLPCMLVIAILQLLPCLAKAQANNISGTVTGVSNTPLEAATVTIKKTTTSVVCDAQGKFSIAANPGQTLLISAVGYEGREIKIGKENNLSITLTQLNSSIDEVVVVGYGTQKKKDLTGSVSSINSRNKKNKYQ